MYYHEFSGKGYPCKTPFLEYVSASCRDGKGVGFGAYAGFLEFFPIPNPAYSRNQKGTLKFAIDCRERHRGRSLQGAEIF